MRFKMPQQQKEFETLHPTVKARIIQLDEWLLAQNWQPVMVTHVLRSVQEQASIYQGKKAFSWHMVACAVDFRNWWYSTAQIQAILAYLKEICDSNWEILAHDVGRGQHFHLALKDQDWKRDWQTKGGIA